MRPDQERLLFRRQFVLGPRFLEGYPSWRRTELGSSLRLTSHPDLPVTRASGTDVSMVLIGYLLDPFHPADRDSDILGRLLRRMEEGGNRESLIRLTYPYGGRWILIVEAGQDCWLFTDPCGHRSVFFTVDPQPLWCASQPSMLAELLGLSMDRDALRFFHRYRRRDFQYCWPGDTSPYNEIRHLRPNHTLDLRTRASRRFWPRGDLTPRPTEDVVRENAQLLQGIIEGASRRFALSLGLTAGRDTRTLLAGSRAIRHGLYCFTSMYWDLSWNSPDVRVPARLLPGLGMSHHVVVCPARMDRDFGRVFRRNVATAHDCYGPVVQGDYEGQPRNLVCMVGYAAPIFSVPYRHRLQRWRPQTDLGHIDVETLEYCTYREDPFSRAAIGRWLSNVPPSNLHVLDLFYWEEREGNWEAMGLAEWDLARESFAPFNCRQFLVNALSIPEKDRKRPLYPFHESLMRHMWPEVLSEPLNPPDEGAGLSVAIRSLDQLREKISNKPPRTMATPVTRAFQRHPWLTDLARISWPTTPPAAPDRGSPAAGGHGEANG